MKQLRDAKGRFVRGAGGGGGGGSSGGAEAPDSLRSNQIARYIDALCEGEIRGLVDGLKSVYINGTPLENGDGSRNFGGIDLQWRTGTLTQTPMDGFSQTEIENYVSTEVKASQPITRTLNNPTCKEVRVTVAVPGLSSYDSNGNINGSSVSFQISIQNNGGGFVTMVSDTISGKTSSKYKRAYRLKLPGSGPWDIRVTRTTPDSTSSKVQNSLLFDAFTGIVPSVVAYINTAVVGVALNAQQFAGVPERGYEIYGRIIQVPTNYDPLTRAYSGAWDGSFKMAWSDNPAWCFYDMLTQPRFGLGDFVDATTVDKWSLYTIGKYCDQMVPNGMGGTEPRFSCNLVLQSREDAYKVIQNMASIFRAIAYWGAAGVIAVQDMPGDVAAVYTNANVIDGKFTYQGSSTNVRHTVALVAWNDPNDGYKQSVEYVQDDELVEKYGIIQIEVTAFGCTSRAQAYRYGRWALMTERIETETVSFACGFDGLETGTGAGLFPGAVIQTSDILRAGKRMGGRLKDGNTTTVLQLDAPKTLVAGKQYRVLVSMPEGKPVERAVINVGGEVSTLTLASALPYQPTVDAVIALIESDSVELETWRVLGVVEADTGALECTAIKHNPDKYDAVELGFALDEIPISNISARPSAPTGLTFFVAQRSLDGSVSNLTGTLSWEGSAAKYRVAYRFEKEPWVSLETSEQSIDVPNLQVGQYEFAVTAVSALGITSMQATLTYSVTPQPIQLPDVTGLMMEGTYVTDTAKFKWDTVAGATGYEVKIEAGGQVRRTVSVGNALRFDYASGDMRVDGGPWRSYTFSVRAVGKWGSASSWASLTAGNPQIAALQGIKIESGIKSGFFSCASPVEDDFAGVIIWLSTDPACSPVPTNQVYEGQDTFVTLSHLADGTPLAGGTTYYLRAAGYDTFGMDSLNVSTAVSFVPWDVNQMVTELAESQLNQSLRTRINLIDAPGTGLVDKVGDLQGTYGNTASSAASAAAAAQSASDAITAKAAAIAAQSGAETAKSAATTAKTNAETAASNASVSAGNAAASATSAAGSASTASSNATTAANAATTAGQKADAASTSATNAAASATAAGQSATSSASSATAASNSAGSAKTYRDEASTSATTAGTKASEAASSANSASTSAGAAATSATKAGNSASAAATSASTASTKATEASQSATSANSSKTAAATSASQAGTSATQAASSATAADGSARSAAQHVTNLVARVGEQVAWQITSAGYGKGATAVRNMAGEVLAGGGAHWRVLSISAGNTLSGPLFGTHIAANATAMAYHIAGLADGTNVIIMTYDNPPSGLAAIRSALISCGATGAVLDGIGYRSAYILAGVKGAGEGGGIEKYHADTTELLIQVSNGKIIGLAGQPAAASLKAAIQSISQVVADNQSATAQQINTISATVDANKIAAEAAVQTEATARANADNSLFAQYTIKVQSGKYFAGIGLASESPDYGPGNSKIIMLADQFGVGSPGQATQFPFVVDTARNIVGVNGNLVVNGNAIMDNLAANSVSMQFAKAGTLNVNTLQSGTGGGNLLPNAAMVAEYNVNGLRRPDGYSVYSGKLIATDYIYGLDRIGEPWRHATLPAIDIEQPNNYYNGQEDAFVDVYATQVPVAPGQWYEFSVYTGVHRCKISAVIYFADASGNWLRSASGGINMAAAGGKTFNDFHRHFAVVQAPAGALTANLWIRRSATLPGYTNSWSRVLAPYLGVANGPNQSQPSPWSPSGVGTQMHGGVLKTGTVTADRMAVTSLSAITGNMGYLTAGEVHGGSFHSGGFSGAYAWPPAGQRGFHLGPNGLLMGNANDGHWVQIDASGQNFTMPGLRMQNGTLYVDQLEVIGAANIKSNNICTSAMAESPGASYLSVTVSLPKTAVYLISAIRKVFPGVNNTYNNYFRILVNGNYIANESNDQQTSLEKNIILGAGTYTITAESGIPLGKMGTSQVLSLSAIGIIK